LACSVIRYAFPLYLLLGCQRSTVQIPTCRVRCGAIEFFYTEMEVCLCVVPANILFAGRNQTRDSRLEME
jgi:hypothetical protein